MKFWSQRILIAEDDPDDRVLISHALADAGIREAEYVTDGQELLDYLDQVHANRDGFMHAGMPALILVDLNMPRIGGLAAVRKIRSDSRSNHVPLVVLSTSNAPGDIRRAYESGASSYVVKPPSYQALVEVMRTLELYWFKTVSLPRPT